ncbi:MAG: NDP-sugar synthase [Candidatus Aenigmatarchaeota archaeon]
MTDKVVILAGGKGTRLNPLTQARPKPSVYIGGNKRFGEYVIDMGLRAGYADFYMVLEHMGDEIEKNFRDGSDFRYMVENQHVPIRIGYVRALEGKESKGTADGLRLSRPYLADSITVKERTTGSTENVSLEDYRAGIGHLSRTGYVEKYDAVVVLSGDHISSLDLSELVRFHKQRGAFASMGLIQVDPDRIAGKLGMVGYDPKTGTVHDFREKPKTKDEVIYTTANTGIYVFDRSIMQWLDQHPEMIDFGREVFPALLLDEKLGKDVCALVLDGYWNDVGTLDDYRATSMQLIDRIKGVDDKSHRLRVQENSRVLGRASRYLMGQGCYVGRNVEVTESIFCNDIEIEDSPNSNAPSVIDRSILFHNVKVGSSVDLKGVISDSDVTIESGAVVGEGVVIGKGTTLTKKARIGQNAQIGMNCVITGTVEPGETVTD